MDSVLEDCLPPGQGGLVEGLRGAAAGNGERLGAGVPRAPPRVDHFVEGLQIGVALAHHLADGDAPAECCD